MKKIERNEELRKIFENYAANGGNLMSLIPKIEELYDNELKFKITKMVREKKLFGSTLIEAECVQDGKKVTLSVIDQAVNDTELLKNLIYQSYLTMYSDNNAIKVGDIL